MIRFRRSLCIAIFCGSVAIGATPSPGQNVIGDALGQLILPAVGPVLERAAGEVILEGARRGYENGRLLPRRGISPPPRPTLRRQRSSGTPSGTPTPPYSSSMSPTYHSGSTSIPNQSTRSYSGQQQPALEPTPVRPPADGLPENRINSRPAVSPNLSLMDIAMTHVVSAGPEATGQVIRIEAAHIANQLDLAAKRFLDSAGADSGASTFNEEFQRLLSKPRPENSRSALMVNHHQALSSLANRQGLTALLKSADSAERVASLPGDGDHDELTQSIDQMRSDLMNVPGSVIGGDELAILAQRVKNVRNMSVLSEIARVLGTQRREDLLLRVAEAADKSDAPEEAITELLGVTLGPTGNAVGDMQLPQGIPAVVLYNPSINTSPVSFVCDDSLEVTLSPGELVPLDQAFVVSFRNGSGAVKRYSLESGMYRWIVEDAGWDLRQKIAANVTIDAIGSPAEFHYLLNGQPQVVDAGGIVSHSLDGPVRIDFDLGRGDGSIKSTLMTPGHYTVGANAETAGWDLHPQSTAEPAVDTTTSVAKEHWRRSVVQATRVLATDPAEAKVDALLDLIE